VEVGKWAKEWEKVKKAFKTATGKKKPATKTLGAFRKSTGIESTLKKMDQAFAPFRGLLLEPDFGPDDPQFTKFERTISDYNTKMTAYLRVLQAALNSEADADSIYSKHLVILKKDLQAIHASADAQLTFTRNMANKELERVERLRRSWLKMLKATVKKASLFVAQVKADPTPEHFNDYIYRAARDMTQNMNNIKKAIDKGDGRWTMQSANKNYVGLVKVLEAWANNGREVPNDADEKRVLRELGAFAQAVRGVAKFVQLNS